MEHPLAQAQDPAPDSSSTMGSNGSTEPTSLTIQILGEITNNFSEKRALGRGAYGKVYKGVHRGEEIAVKLFHNNLQATDEQFKNEFNNLMVLRHPNIVRLVGYCYDTQHEHVDFQGKIVFGETTYKALCFEYMHMGSLQKHLSDIVDGLDWKTRYSIIKGACEGLKYLHEGFKEPIYHLDIKPDNILLDENMTPKLADFGLSKFFGEEQTRVTNSPIGTIGYMPPEYIYGRVVSKKLDVFSLGVVITKIIAGPKGPIESDEKPYQEFLEQVHEKWRNRLEAACTSSRILEAYCEQVIICTEIGLSSMKSDRNERPNIMKIIDRLDQTETNIKKAILLSANSHSPMVVKSSREKDNNLVKVEAFARNKTVQGAETCNKFPVLVRVTAAPWRRTAEMPRAGVDVVVALNIKMNDVKEAMIMLVERLSSNDRLSILFSRICMQTQHVMELTYMSDHGRGVARLKISELAHGHVRQYSEYEASALQEAAQILRQRGVEEISNRTGCIMHMWTGPMHPKIHEEDISREFPVHTIAIGNHDARGMKRVADKTSGTYSFIKGRNLDNIKYALVLFIARITSVAVRSVGITLQADEGVTISSIVSGCYSSLVSSDNRFGTIDIYNICAGEQKNFIVYLKVPQGKEKLVTVGGRYESLNTSGELVGMDVVISRPRRKCRSDEVIIHPKVAAELLRIRLMKGVLDRNGDNIESLWDRMKNSDEGRDAQEETFADLEKDVTEMGGQDRDKMELSWLNSHEWQCATTKEIASSSGAFGILEQQHTSLVKIEGFTRSKAMMGSEACDKFPVLVRVTAAPWRHTGEMPRDGVDVVIMLDISKNIQVERLERMKQAMLIMIDKLSPNDRLSIVVLQTNKSHLMELTYMSNDPGHGRDVARFKISQLKTTSGRYMCHSASAFLQEGAQILRDRGAEESISRLGCMLFLSDGKYPQILQIKINNEFPVHTFGLGADHNPKVLKYIADMTSGTYSFVDPDTSNIKDALALFITGLTSIAAKSIMITLRVHSGIEIASIESGGYIHDVKSDKMSGTININHIYAGEQKDFIVHLTVWNGRKKLVTISGQYQSINGSMSLAQTDLSLLRPWSTCSSDKLAIHHDVAMELTRTQLQKGVSAMLEKDLSVQGLQKMWEVIKDSDIGHATPEKALYGLSLDVGEMQRDVSGLAYMLSWLSCHKWQSATTKGAHAPYKSSVVQTIWPHTDKGSSMVKVETFTRSRAIPSEDPCNNFPVLVRVAAEPWRCAEEMPRVGIDIVAVLDVSMRMQGKKLDQMKQAMMVVIDRLSANDRLSIVSFNTYENRLMKLTHMSDHVREIARLKINKLSASGQNDMGAALREGAQILSWRGAECNHRVGCMMLLSDGKYSEIFQTKLDSEFPVHTFGLGTDHNPDVMKYIADMTSGTYTFMNQDIDRIKDALVLFITSLTSVAAMSIKITLRTGEGITILSIESSGGDINHVKSDDGSGTIDIYSIYAGEKTDFIVYLTVAEGKKELMTIGGRYLGFDTVKHLTYTDVHVQRPHQKCLPDDLAIQPDVAAELVRIRLKKGISAMLEQGPSSTELDKLWDGIINSDEGHGTPEEILSGLSMDFTEMKRDIEHPEEYRKSGLPYTLSWLTCQKCQRATTKAHPPALVVPKSKP
ncbi:uncharacterized protein LOC124646765 [Lolium rigidum]|uniref:uncharacterized protein LOC124646765 n=1 Tax=Lolium rigidum TaxID=89674 RepID=UPI001F5D33B0|nr:uncharacterized protein LOC124646765 [Lolium rigidum]